MVKSNAYYEILGVPETATTEEIRKAYRKLALQYHPDKNPNGGARFQEIAEAFQVLSDPVRRARYDREGRINTPDGSDLFTVAMDMFQKFFASEGNKAADIQCKVFVTLNELYTGVEKWVTYERKVLCDYCFGTGSCNPQMPVHCINCAGKGTIRQTRATLFGLTQRKDIPCINCDGTGQHHDYRCSHCSGTKTTYMHKRRSLYIPRGLRAGRRVRLTGEGHQCGGKIPGDLLYLILMLPHDVYERVGNNLQMKMDIDLAEAIGGFKRHIVTLDDRILTLTVESGEIIKEGSTYSLAGEGMPIPREGNRTQYITMGDLLITFHIVWPSEITLTPEQVRQMNEWLPAVVRKSKTSICDFKGKESAHEGAVEKILHRRAIRGANANYHNHDNTEDDYPDDCNTQ